MMSKKDKKVCTILDYIEELFVLAFAVSGCLSISSFASLGLTTSTVGLNICTINNKVL